VSSYATPTPGAFSHSVAPDLGLGQDLAARSHWLGGGTHDAALVLWDEMQQQAQWEQIRLCREEISAHLGGDQQDKPGASAKSAEQDPFGVFKQSEEHLAVLELRICTLEEAARSAGSAGASNGVQSQLARGVETEVKHVAHDLEAATTSLALLTDEVRGLEFKFKGLKANKGRM